MKATDKQTAEVEKIRQQIETEQQQDELAKRCLEMQRELLKKGQMSEYKQDYLFALQELKTTKVGSDTVKKEVLKLLDAVKTELASTTKSTNDLKDTYFDSADAIRKTSGLLKGKVKPKEYMEYAKRPKKSKSSSLFGNIMKGIGITLLVAAAVAVLVVAPIAAAALAGGGAAGMAVFSNLSGPSSLGFLDDFDIGGESKKHEGVNAVDRFKEMKTQLKDTVERESSSSSQQQRQNDSSDSQEKPNEDSISKGP